MKFSELSNKQKVIYIGEYYKFHIIGGIVAIALIINLASTIIENKNTETILDVTFFTQYYSQEQLATLQEELYELLYDESGLKYQKVFFENIYASEYADMNTVSARETKFVVKAMEEEYDIIVVDKESMRQLLDNGIIKPLDKLIEEGIIEVDPSLYVTGQSVEDSQEYIYGVSSMANSTINEMVKEESEVVICIAFDELNYENTIEAFSYLTNSK